MVSGLPLPLRSAVFPGPREGWFYGQGQTHLLWASLAACGKGEVGVSLVLLPCRALESGDGGVEGALKNNAQGSFLIGQGGVYPGYF